MPDDDEARGSPDEARPGTRDGARDGAGRGPARLVLRAAAALVLIAGLSLMARPSPPPAGGGGPASASAAGPAGPARAPGAARAAEPVAEAPRLRLDDGGEPARPEAGRPGPLGRGREGVLARGDFTAIEEPALRLTLVQDGGEPPGLFVLLARRAAGAAALSVLRTGARERLATKFGPVETLEVTLGGGAGPARACTGFATLPGTTPRLDGWLCAPLGRPPEPQALACTLDALVLDGGGAEAVGDAFRAAEARRDPACRARRPLAQAETAGRTGSIGRRAAREAEARSRH